MRDVEINRASWSGIVESGCHTLARALQFTLPYNLHKMPSSGMWPLSAEAFRPTASGRLSAGSRLLSTKKVGHHAASGASWPVFGGQWGVMARLCGALAFLTVSWWRIFPRGILACQCGPPGFVVVLASAAASVWGIMARVSNVSRFGLHENAHIRLHVPKVPGIGRR